MGSNIAHWFDALVLFAFTSELRRYRRQHAGGNCFHVHAEILSKLRGKLAIYNRQPVIAVCRVNLTAGDSAAAVDATFKPNVLPNVAGGYEFPATANRPRQGARSLQLLGPNTKDAAILFTTPTSV